MSIVQGPRVWNSLSAELRTPDISMMDTFRNKLKTYLFNVWLSTKRIYCIVRSWRYRNSLIILIIIIKSWRVQENVVIFLIVVPPFIASYRCVHAERTDKRQSQMSVETRGHSAQRADNNNDNDDDICNIRATSCGKVR